MSEKKGSFSLLSTESVLSPRNFLTVSLTPFPSLQTLCEMLYFPQKKFHLANSFLPYRAHIWKSTLMYISGFLFGCSVPEALVKTFYITAMESEKQ